MAFANTLFAESDWTYNSLNAGQPGIDNRGTDSNITEVAVGASASDTWSNLPNVYDGLDTTFAELTSGVTVVDDWYSQPTEEPYMALLMRSPDIDVSPFPEPKSVQPDDITVFELEILYENPTGVPMWLKLWNSDEDGARDGIGDGNFEDYFALVKLPKTETKTWLRIPLLDRFVADWGVGSSSYDIGVPNIQMAAWFDPEPTGTPWSGIKLYMVNWMWSVVPFEVDQGICLQAEALIMGQKAVYEDPNGAPSIAESGAAVSTNRFNEYVTFEGRRYGSLEGGSDVAIHDDFYRRTGGAFSSGSSPDTTRGGTHLSSTGTIATRDGTLTLAGGIYGTVTTTDRTGVLILSPRTFTAPLGG